MTVLVSTSRTDTSGTRTTSPVGYYRVGQSYPRTAARLSYPRRRRALAWGHTDPIVPATPTLAPTPDEYLILAEADDVNIDAESDILYFQDEVQVQI